jgi:hypothetical protein
MANTITQIKRLVGLKFDDAAVKAELETHANFNAIAMPDGDVGFEVRLVPHTRLSAPTVAAVGREPYTRRRRRRRLLRQRFGG